MPGYDDETLTQAPDVQAATGRPTAPAPDPLAAITGLIDTIQSMSEAPLFPTAEGRFGAGMMGLGAALQGRQNPAVDWAMSQRKMEMQALESQMRQRVALEGLRIKLKEEALKKEESARGIYQTLAKDDDPRLKSLGVRGLLGLLKNQGVDLPPNIEEGLLTNRIDAKDLPRLGQLIEMGAPVSVIQRTFPAFTQADYAAYQQFRSNPNFRVMAGLKPLDEAEKDRLERDQKTLNLLYSQYGIAGESPQANAVKQMAFHLFSKTFDRLTEVQRKQVIDQFDITAADKPKLSDVASLRGQYLQQSKTWEDVRDAYGRISRMAERPSPAGDIALITGYMKLIDPSTGVKEGEFATARNAGSIPDTVRALYNRLVSGTGFLTHNQRMDFFQRAYGLFAEHRLRQSELEKEFQGIAIRSKMPAPDAVPDLIGALRGVTVPKRTIQIRHKKTGRTGTAEIGPEDVLPPGVEAID